MRTFIFAALVASGTAFPWRHHRPGYFGYPASSPVALSAPSSAVVAPAPVQEAPAAVAAPVSVTPIVNNVPVAASSSSWTSVVQQPTPSPAAVDQPTSEPVAMSNLAVSNAATSGKVRFAGVNIAGFDFGCTTDGTCNTNGIYDIASNGNGIAQMNHFVKDDGLNAFRLPVGWQFLVNNKVGGVLDAANFPKYDKLVQGCLSSSAKMCIVDIHNYARWNGGIIGQGGPTNDQYTNLLTQLAQKYKEIPQIAFGIMNEPHDLNINTWATTAQAAVTAIRNAGALSQVILIPGTGYTSAGGFAPNSGPSLLGIKNPDGSTRNLIFDVHQYLDADYSGTHTNCVSNNINGAFSPLATWLRQHGRQAMLTETGGGPNDSSCVQNFCQQMDYINQNSDVFLGVTTWAAGGFDQNYELSETPVQNGNSWTDRTLVQQCVVAKFRGASG